jgi:hypothetical protein
VEAPDRTTEIFLIDQRFRRIASAVGSLRTEVRPGYYKVRFRSGKTQRDQLVEVPPGEGTVRVRGAHIHFQSAAPIAETATTREDHRDHAAAESRRVHLRHGRGGQIFLFARDLAPEGASLPWEGVSLHDLDGARIAELGAGVSSAPEHFAALNVEVDPGTYRLRVETPPLGVYEMFLVACPNWQCQVYLLAGEFRAGAARVRRATLRTASLLMVRPGVGFDPHSEHLRLADLARLGLESGRSVVRGEDLNELLFGKFENPMLGIYGAHLLLLEHRRPHALIDKVQANLTRLLGPHPDVLALGLRPGAPAPPRDLSFPTPPMLQSSWDLIVRGSHQRHALVPSGSLTDRIADGLLDAGPWLLHRVPDAEPARAAEEVGVAEARRKLKKLLELAATPEGLERLKRARRERLAMSSLELGILNSALQPPLAAELTELQYPEMTVAQVFRNVGAPSASIARSAASLWSKVEGGKTEAGP